MMLSRTAIIGQGPQSRRYDALAATREVMMPFDGTQFYDRKRPERPAFSETLMIAIMVVTAVSLLVLPISMTALVDVVRYIRGH